MSQEELLNEAKRKRKCIKSKITKFGSFVNAFHNEQDDLINLKLRYEKFQGLLDEYETVQSEIEDLLKCTEEDIDERTSVEESFYEISSKVYKLLNPATRNSAVTGNQIQSQDLSSQATNQLVQARLPQLALVEFSGKYSDWLLFKDSFQSQVDSKLCISDIDKFLYLRSALKGEALKIISNLETSASNYSIAWNLLEQRYENKKLIINTHMKAMFEMPMVKENYGALRQFVDSMLTHMRALEAYNQPVAEWDTILIYLTTTKLEFNIRKEWETFISKEKPNDLPKMTDLIKFLTNKCQTLELVNKNKSIYQETKSFGKHAENKMTFTSYKNDHRCELCNQQHYIFKCNEFLKLPITSRIKEVKRLQLCMNCLKVGHYSSSCKSSTCQKCRKHHNSLLHMENNTKRGEDKTLQLKNSSEREDQLETEQATASHSIQSHHAYILLSTALIYILDVDGNTHLCRTLLDSGSQCNFITQDLISKLRLTWENIHMPIRGISQISTKVSRLTEVKLQSRFNNFTTSIRCFIVPVITDQLPQMEIDYKRLNIPTNIKLADDTFHLPGSIDLLIGAELFWKLLCVGQIRLLRNQPILQKSHFGWLVSGSISNDTRFQQYVHCNISTTTAIENQLEKFWCLEEVPCLKPYSSEEAYCETHFVNTIRRNQNGRFVVSLPKKQSVQLGNSLDKALKCLYSLERRLYQDPDLRSEYNKFMDEYCQLNHMTAVDYLTDEIKFKLTSNESLVYFLPHHPIIKKDKITSKIRVVFNASTITTSGNSLNDKLMVGPCIQENLFNIIVRFRTFQYVLTADIAMMYRQIEMSKDDRSLQSILWRRDTNEPIQIFTLNTVTYGTSSAPFLATRCLKQLAIEDGYKFPLASSVVTRDFYMDDVLTGTHTREEALALHEQLDRLLSLAQFKLRKWRSNDLEILKHIESQYNNESLMVIKSEDPIKTLGLRWDAKTDTFQYYLNNDQGKRVTKRTILSTVSQIFDPLGLVGPIIINAKVLMQQLWQLRIDWDESVPQAVFTKWNTIYKDIVIINQLKIARNINPNNSSRKLTLHGFCDASLAAFGCCIYATSQNGYGSTNSYLICAKSRVAPLKSQSLPRLELCGALLLSQLMQVVQQTLNELVTDIHYWTDSSIVLAWIKTTPNKLKIFVSNRVAEIQLLTANKIWHHVSSQENPADIISRGTTAKQLMDNELWWKGPSWLNDPNNWPTVCAEVETDTNMEYKPNSFLVNATYSEPSFLTKYSSFSKLQRVVSYCFRFIYNCKFRFNHMVNALTVEEIERATTAIVLLVQREEFSSELQVLKDKKLLPKNSKIISLNPFLDNKGLIRVGGRLVNSKLTPDQKYPILLPSKHFITKSILWEMHKRLHHCGQEQLLAAVRLKYWPISARRVIKSVIHNCVPCFKVNPTIPQHFMGDLPSSRVTESTKPFDVVGIDYAGPLQVKESHRRGKIHIIKAYVAVFVCFKTKAVHLELVSMLTTEAFLAALMRFTARRGICREIHSDNATNFVGANQRLREIYEFIANSSDEIATDLARQQIKWCFIPSRSPHFGGLWEATIKTIKRNFYKTVQNSVLTFEESYTLLTGIEACLNSRPITPISTSPNDLLALTPSHFLIGETLLQPPEKNLINVPCNLLSRWQHLQKLRQYFWKRWSFEYLQQLQTRNKWFLKSENLKLGLVVVLIEENVPPLKWKLGLINELFPGKDGIVRVVSVKTANGILQRSIKKLCVLPSVREI